MNAQMWRRTKNPLLWPDFVYRWTDDYKVCNEYIAHIHDYMNDLIAKRREELSSGRRRASLSNGRPTDFLQHLLDAAEANPEAQPDSQILSNVTGLIFAAFDTSCIAMGWILYAMAKYPEWQDKCRAEVEQAIGDHDPTYDSLSELKNVTMFVKECLRLWPPVPILGRINPSPFEAGGATIPASTWLEVG